MRARSTEQSTTPTRARRKKVRKWIKTKDKPKHPLNAYNMFFHCERARLLTEAGGSKPQAAQNAPKAPNPNGFANLARCVAARWKTIDSASKAFFEERARLDRCRYQQEIADWKISRGIAQAPPSACTATRKELPEMGTLTNPLTARKAPPNLDTTNVVVNPSPNQASQTPRAEIPINPNVFVGVACGGVARRATIDSASKTSAEERARLDSVLHQTELTEWKRQRESAEPLSTIRPTRHHLATNVQNQWPLSYNDSLATNPLPEVTLFPRAIPDTANLTTYLSSIPDSQTVSAAAAFNRSEFVDLARGAAARWRSSQSISTAIGEERARLDLVRHQEELAGWKKSWEATQEPPAACKAHDKVTFSCMDAAAALETACLSPIDDLDSEDFRRLRCRRMLHQIPASGFGGEGKSLNVASLAVGAVPPAHRLSTLYSGKDNAHARPSLPAVDCAARVALLGEGPDPATSTERFKNGPRVEESQRAASSRTVPLGMVDPRTADVSATGTALATADWLSEVNWVHIQIASPGYRDLHRMNDHDSPVHPISDYLTARRNQQQLQRRRQCHPYHPSSK